MLSKKKKKKIETTTSDAPQSTIQRRLRTSIQRWTTTTEGSFQIRFPVVGIDLLYIRIGSAGAKRAAASAKMGDDR